MSWLHGEEWWRFQHWRVSKAHCPTFSSRMVTKMIRLVGHTTFLTWLHFNEVMRNDSRVNFNKVNYPILENIIKHKPWSSFQTLEIFKYYSWGRDNSIFQPLIQQHVTIYRLATYNIHRLSTKLQNLLKKACVRTQNATI